MRAHRKHWTDEHDAKLRQLYESGHTIAQMAEILGRTYGAIQVRLTDMGVGHAGRTGPDVPGAPQTTEERERREHARKIAMSGAWR